MRLASQASTSDSSQPTVRGLSWRRDGKAPWRSNLQIVTLDKPIRAQSSLVRTIRVGGEVPPTSTLPGAVEAVASTLWLSPLELLDVRRIVAS
jgi:hypothetical protein